MGLFVREKLIYKERGKKEEWKRAQALLKEAGLKLSVTELPGEAPICGCGAKLDIRDFGPQGKIDRNFYYIDVPEKDYEKARDPADGGRVFRTIILFLQKNFDTIVSKHTKREKK